MESTKLYNERYGRYVSDANRLTTQLMELEGFKKSDKIVKEKRLLVKLVFRELRRGVRDKELVEEQRDAIAWSAYGLLRTIRSVDTEFGINLNPGGVIPAKVKPFVGIGLALLGPVMEGASLIERINSPLEYAIIPIAILGVYKGMTMVREGLNIIDAKAEVRERIRRTRNTAIKSLE